MAVEQKIAALESGIAAMCTTSGQAAILIAILNLCKAGDKLYQPHTDLWRCDQPLCPYVEQARYRMCFCGC